jgi:cyclopropane fatty-acyl-phospholipid synthase-like methyltransferase
MSDYYQKHFREYHRKTFSIDPSSFLMPLVDHLKPGSIILDVGCGSGRDLLWLERRGYKAIGLERSRGLADLARKHSGCRVIAADFETYNFPQMRVDAVLLVGALVHLSHKQVPDTLQSISTALAKGGLMLLSMKKGEGNVADATGRTFHLWTNNNLRAVFRQVNLHAVENFQQKSLTGSQEIWLSHLLRLKQSNPA